MPVELEKIPNKQSQPSRPATRRWLLLGAIVASIATGTTFLLWQGVRTGPRFWFIALVVPILVWGILFAGRRAGYKLLSVGQESANSTIESRHASDRRRGQRFSWFFGEYLLNALEREHLSTQKAAFSKTPILQPVMPRQEKKPIRHSRFAEEGSAGEVLDCYQDEVISRINKSLELLPSGMLCYLALDMDGELVDIVLGWLPGISRPLTRIHGLSGLRILDYWLDYHYEKPSALLIISAQLYSAPQDDSGEAISVLWVTNCRLKDTPAASVRLHRPQINQNGDLGHAIKHAVLWAGLVKEAPLRGWITGGKLASSDTLNAASETYAPELTTQRCVNIDTVAGFAGMAAPWQAMTLAARQCLGDGEAQLVVIESPPDCWQVCAVTPE